MSWLLDVNFVLASRWKSHLHHAIASQWIDSLPEFYTTATTELGFVRVSLSEAYRATWEETQLTLRKLQSRQGYRFLIDDLDGASSPITRYKDTTDAHIEALAQRHRLKLATLDKNLLIKPWAKGIAENPIAGLDEQPGRQKL